MYRGEEQNLYLKGGSSYDLSSIDFSVYVYPDGILETTFRKDKSDCVEQTDGSYLCTYGPEDTKQFRLAPYTIEIHDKTNNVIFVKKHSFVVEPSASAKDLDSDEDADTTE